MSLALVVMCDDPTGCGITAHASPGPWADYAAELERRGWTVGRRAGDRHRQLTRDLCPECTQRRAARKASMPS
ncbi:hypothetical protein GCM10018962_77300 [Dactylosporangium matsuzakiense]